MPSPQDLGAFQFDAGYSTGSNSGAYDALESKGRRKAAPTRIMREDAHLRGNKRTSLQASANDIQRNFAVAAWAIRRHLDYASRFDFHSRTKDRGLDKAIEELMREQSMARNFDRGGRVTRERGFRMAEARRVLDGDTGFILLQDGRLQGIEADLIRDPEKQLGPHEWVDGTEADYAGLIRNFSIWGRSRGGVGYEFKRIIPAQNFIHYGFFERYASEQRRGVSPIIASLNNYRDVYEGIDYALVKNKIAQLFALAMSRDTDAEPLDKLMPGVSADDDTDDDETTDLPRTIDLTHGPTVLDLDPGEKVEVVESKNPSMELQAFSKLVLMIAFKSLDIPYSFFDEGHTNYSGSRSAWLHYERSTLTNRDDQIEMRKRWTVYQYQRWLLNDQLKLPRRMTIDDCHFEWVPLGMPWWKPSEEIAGDLKAIASCLDSPINVTKARGSGDIFDNIEDLLEVLLYAKTRGTEVLGEPLRLNFDPGPFAAAIMDGGQDKPQGN
jgi:capsid protein